MRNFQKRGLLAGKIAFVTGGARGLGHKIAQVFAEAGACGTIFDILPEKQGGPVPSDWDYWRGDVTCEAGIRDAMEATFRKYRRLDTVVANAGVVPNWLRTRNIDLDAWRKTFAVNVEGVAICLKHAARIMEPAGGSIVAMGSLNSWKGHEQQAAYVASKHAVLGLVRAAALDLGRHGIRVNAVGPGPVATEALTERVKQRARQGGLSFAEAFAAMENASALGRTPSEDDIADACLFLASDLSGSITGQILPVDAGVL